jgi:hypothetical protein
VRCVLDENSRRAKVIAYPVGCCKVFGISSCLALGEEAVNENTEGIVSP